MRRLVYSGPPHLQHNPLPRPIDSIDPIAPTRSGHPVSTTDVRPSPAAKGRSSLVVQLALPLVGAALLLLWLEGFGGNRAIADALYAAEGHDWLLRDHVITSTLIHMGGKYLSEALWLAAFATWWIASRVPAVTAIREPLSRLLLSTVVATVLVSVLQPLFAMDCPWDIIGYGGSRPYLTLFEARPSGLHAAACFPSGHASSGYCWIALYFFFADVAPRWRFRGLLFGLALGFVFGLGQQLRGAHFASHDVASLLVCWLSALTLQWVWTRRRH